MNRGTIIGDIYIYIYVYMCVCVCVCVCVRRYLGVGIGILPITPPDHGLPLDSLNKRATKGVPKSDSNVDHTATWILQIAAKPYGALCRPRAPKNPF